MPSKCHPARGVLCENRRDNGLGVAEVVDEAPAGNEGSLLYDMRRDWLLLGGFSGAVAAAARLVMGHVLYRLGVSRLRFPEIAGGAVLGKRGGAKPRTPIEMLVGGIADITLGIAFGSLLARVMVRTPKKHYVAKGAGMGLGLWATTLTLGNLLRIDGLANPRPQDMLSLLATTTAFGAITGLLLDSLGRRLTRTQAAPLKVQVVPEGRRTRLPGAAPGESQTLAGVPGDRARAPVTRPTD